MGIEGFGTCTAQNVGHGIEGGIGVENELMPYHQTLKTTALRAWLDGI